MMNGDEILKLAKKQSTPDLWPWLDEEFALLRDGLLDFDDPVLALCHIAQETARCDDWISPEGPKGEAEVRSANANGGRSDYV